MARAVAHRLLDHALAKGSGHMLHAYNTCPPRWARATLLAYNGNGNMVIEFPRDDQCEECWRNECADAGCSPTQPFRPQQSDVVSVGSSSDGDDWQEEALREVGEQEEAED
eukprot:5630026-Alexandrium_andersonii.AAC.1